MRRYRTVAGVPLTVERCYAASDLGGGYDFHEDGDEYEVVTWMGERIGICKSLTSAVELAKRHAEGKLKDG